MSVREVSGGRDKQDREEIPLSSDSTGLLLELSGSVCLGLGRDILQSLSWGGVFTGSSGGGVFAILFSFSNTTMDDVLL